jgi:hypothetical protein
MTQCLDGCAPREVACDPPIVGVARSSNSCVLCCYCRCVGQRQSVAVISTVCIKLADLAKVITCIGPPASIGPTVGLRGRTTIDVDQASAWANRGQPNQAPHHNET